MRDIYITNNGTLSRKDNSLLFENEKQKRTIPIQDVDNIFVFSEVTINSKLLNFLSQTDISVYFFNYYGFYSGTFAPRKKNLSGKLLIQQVDCYTNVEKRLSLAKEVVLASIHNMRKTLMQYELKEEAEKMNDFKQGIDDVKSVQNLLLKEAESKEFYYKQLNKIIKDPQFAFVKRVRHPPDNYINTLISFGNSLLYTAVLSEILKTQLDPTIAYLHEPFERRYSLNLDVADIFKPLIVDRIIFSLINRQQIKPEHFDKELNYCHLNKEGRAIFLKEYDAKLQTTLKYPGINRNVSYKYMLRLECYKLIKYFLENEKYKAFRIYW